jgi:hypothetical protein
MDVFVVSYDNILNDKHEVYGVAPTLEKGLEMAKDLLGQSDSLWKRDFAYENKKASSGTVCLYYYNKDNKWVIIESYPMETL